MEKWKVISSEKIIDNPWLTVEKQACKIGRNIRINDYYVVHKKDYVILIVEDREHIFFLRQYRHGIGKVILNLPMGLINENEKVMETANRELKEETGYEAERWDYLGEFFLAPSYISTKAHIFYTNKIKQKKKIDQDLNEGKLKLVRIAKRKINEILKKDKIKDISTITAILLAKEKLGLF